MHIFNCAKCGKPVTEDDYYSHVNIELNWCEECVEADVQEQIAHYRPLYEAYKHYGLLREHTAEERAAMQRLKR